MNTFGRKHYIPVLKWKRAERRALRALTSDQKKDITPVFQLIPPRPTKKRGAIETQLKDIQKSASKQYQKVAQEISDDWGSNRAFLDSGLLYSSHQRIDTISQILSHASTVGVALTPVINLASESDELSQLSVLGKKHGNGIALRLTRSHLELAPATLSQLIDNCLSQIHFAAAEIDVIIDLQVITAEDVDYPSIVGASQLLPHLEKWRSLTIIGGAFPKDLTNCVVDNKNYCPRTDWDNWARYTNSGSLKRIPSFGDYTIQHPIFNEQAQFFLPSKSIRYTVKNTWLVMRGTKKGPANQYLAHAQLLSRKEIYKEDYYGRDFSFGDDYIYTMGEDIDGPKTGNPETWLTAGINHHLACVAKQVADLT